MSGHQERLRAFAAAAPISGWLGLSLDEIGDDLRFRLGFNEAHIGNPAIRALHGGVIATFLEFAMQAELAARTQKTVSTISQAIDYLSSSRAEDMTARVKLLREGRRVAFLEASGWQSDETRLVAVARCCLKLG
ncbi:MAG: PaaI family thioesterase [Pseudomonadota bacterium]